MTCWSDLANDVLEHITSFLPLTDHHRFSAVCKNWRLVAKQKRQSPAPQLPWLVLGDEPDTGKRKFYNLSEDRHYAMDVPELYGRYICGSSHGWLVAIDIKITGILINPFTHELYELPAFPDFTFGAWDKTGGSSFEKLQVLTVNKAILSHDPKEKPDFMVMILAGFMGIPAFWKPGDSSWTVISVMKAKINDVIYFNEQFVFVTILNELFLLDFQPDPKIYEIVPPLDIGIRRVIGLAQSYLVDYFGYLLLVERWHRAIDERHYKTHNFDVLEPNERHFNRHFKTHYDAKALFLGTNDSIVIDPSKVPGCKYKTSCIYFTDLNPSLFDEKFGFDDMGIFNMSDHTFHTFYSPEISHTRVGTPIWFTPNPW